MGKNFELISALLSYSTQIFVHVSDLICWSVNFVKRWCRLSVQHESYTSYWRVLKHLVMQNRCWLVKINIHDFEMTKMQRYKKYCLRMGSVDGLGRQGKIREKRKVDAILPDIRKHFINVRKNRTEILARDFTNVKRKRINLWHCFNVKFMNVERKDELMFNWDRNLDGNIFWLRAYATFKRCVGVIIICYFYASADAHRYLLC